MQWLRSWKMWLAVAAVGVALMASLAMGAVGVRAAAGVQRLAKARWVELASLGEEGWDCPMLDGDLEECPALNGAYGPGAWDADEGSATRGGLRFGCR